MRASPPAARSTPARRLARGALAAAALVLFLAGRPRSSLAAGDAIEDLRTRHEWVIRATAALEGAPSDPHFNAYRSDYLAALPLDAARPLSHAGLAGRLVGASTVLLGDQHDNLEAKRLAVEVLRGMHAGGPVTLAIEFIEPRFQPVLDDYHAGRIDAAALRDRAYEPSGWSFEWRLYAGLFEGARRLGVPVVAVEPGTHLALPERDAGIARAVRAIPGRVLVFYGSYHLLGRGHLADQLSPQLVITPSAQNKYWTLASGHGLGFDLLELSPALVFANLGTPLEQDGAYLDSLMEMFGYDSLEDLSRDHPSLAPAPARD